jgi:hypothetical protein
MLGSTWTGSQVAPSKLSSMHDASGSVSYRDQHVCYGVQIRSD